MIPAPTRAATMRAVSVGPSSRQIDRTTTRPTKSFAAELRERIRRLESEDHARKEGGEVRDGDRLHAERVHLADDLGRLPPAARLAGELDRHRRDAPEVKRHVLNPAAHARQLPQRLPQNRDVLRRGVELGHGPILRARLGSLDSFDMELLRDLGVSLWSWSVIALSTSVFGSLAILTAWIPPRGRTYLFWARAWARSILFFTGVPATIEISNDAATLPQAIYMSNHESGIDILLLLLVIPQDVRFLAKRSLFWVPFMGWSMWLAGFVPVDRRRTDKARDVLSELDERLAKGTSILVFPEGTRSRDGTLGPFKKSGFLTALKSGVPIVPVGVSGARAVLGAQGMVVRARPGPGARGASDPDGGPRRQGPAGVDGEGPGRDPPALREHRRSPGPPGAVAGG